MGGGRLNSQKFIVTLSTQVKYNYYGQEIN